jgi:hypothetical protein
MISKGEILVIGYIWSVREEWGKKRLYEINSHYDYGYSISRLLKAGDVLVFYSDKKLIGSIPVDTDARLTTDEDRKNHPYWVRDWKYVVGLDGAGKMVFRSPVQVEDIADNVSIFKGKENLHAISRNAPKITIAEYNFILGLASKG